MGEFEPDSYVPEISSKFHGAFNELARLNVLWSECNSLSSSGELMKWRWKLDAIWRELSASANKLDGVGDDEESWSSQNKIINEKIIKARERNELYNLLNEKEEFLRRLQDACGKGTKYTEGDEEDFE